jgi:hypothetical protein
LMSKTFQRWYMVGPGMVPTSSSTQTSGWAR